MKEVLREALENVMSRSDIIAAIEKNIEDYVDYDKIATGLLEAFEDEVQEIAEEVASDML